MTPAPTLHGYLCRICGQEAIEQPWNATDEFRCKNCGALNQTPLLPTTYDVVNFTPMSPDHPMFEHWGSKGDIDVSTVDGPPEFIVGEGGE